MTTVCSNCGTEVDDDALFCPTCGQPMQADARPELPPAPDWPETPRASGDQSSAEAAPQPDSPSALDEGEREPMAAASYEEPPVPTPAPSTARPGPVAELGDQAASSARYHAELGPQRQQAEEVPPWRRGAAYAGSTVPHTASPDDTVQRRVAQPGAGTPADAVTTPETLSAWLAGVGAIVALVALVLPWRTGGSYTAGWGLASGANVGVGILLLGLGFSVFFARLVPQLRRRDLAIATLGTLGVGIGVDRLAMPLTALGASVFLLGMLAVALGGFLALLGYDRRVGGQPS